MGVVTVRSDLHFGMITVAAVWSLGQKDHGWMEGDQQDGLAKQIGGKEGKKWIGYRNNTKSQKSYKTEKYKLH